MKISVIVPAYNSEKTIAGCIESLLKQQGADLEIIVVNDGSSDGTEDVLKSFGDKIKFITRKNGGVAKARNTGLEIATGDFVMFLDSDDTLSDGAVECLVQKQKEYNADIVRFQYLICHKNGKKLRPSHCFDKEEFVEKNEFRKKIYPLYISTIRLNSVCLNMFRANIIKGITFRSDLKTAEDAVFSLNAYTRAENVLIIPDAFYMYNRTEGSITDSGISLITKYKCNFILSGEIIKKLPCWKMNNPLYIAAAALRPVVLTFDKFKRIRLSQKQEMQEEK